MVSMSLLVVFSVAFWIGSIHVEWPNQLALIFIGLAIDLFGGIGLIWLMKEATQKSKTLLKALSHWFEFFPAINIEHRVERNNAFVSLVSVSGSSNRKHPVTDILPGFRLLHSYHSFPVESFLWYQCVFR